MTKEIIPESLVRIYHALGISLPGNVTVEISTGEPSGRNFLQPELIRNLVQGLKGTVVECNAAYEGGRNTSKDHWETMRDHRFTAIAPYDILDEEDHMPLPITGGFHLAENYVGSRLQSYDSMFMLFHSKSHTTGGFDGALRNMSIGLASFYSKTWIHSSSTSTRSEDVFTAGHGSFLESVTNADRSVMDYMGRENIVYISVANRLSVDCDCDAHPHDSEVGDIGIFASTNPVVLDQACADTVYASEGSGKATLIERIESRNGVYAVEATHSLGLDSRGYKLRYIRSYQVTV